MSAKGPPELVGGTSRKNYLIYEECGLHGKLKTGLKLSQVSIFGYIY